MNIKEQIQKIKFRLESINAKRSAKDTITFIVTYSSIFLSGSLSAIKQKNTLVTILSLLLTIVGFYFLNKVITKNRALELKEKKLN